MSPRKSKSSLDSIGTPRFTLAFLQESLTYERESAEFMKKLLEENKAMWEESRIKLVEDIINQHRKNYKTISKQIENL